LIKDGFDLSWWRLGMNLASDGGKFRSLIPFLKKNNGTINFGCLRGVNPDSSKGEGL
jgi:hypothetical protein